MGTAVSSPLATLLVPLIFKVASVNSLGESSCLDRACGPVDSAASNADTDIPTIHLPELSAILESQCALLCLPPCVSTTTLSALSEVRRAYSNDILVFVGRIAQSNDTSISWKDGQEKRQGQLAFYEQELKDRSCLLSPPKSILKAEIYTGQIVPEVIIQFLNERCGAFRTIRGGLNGVGLFHSHIMSNLYHPDTEDCPRINTIPDQATFFQYYLFSSQPVVIEKGAENWPAMKKWTTPYLRDLYGEKMIHIKLTDDGNFEGVESVENWIDHRDDWIPEVVKSQLPYPDLVVVRPAKDEMRLSKFLDLITAVNRSYSAYLEYSSIPFHLPLLEEDINEMPFLGDGLLERKHLNIWLSDGNTLGKLHFDPFDNILCQISGEKHLTLFEPHHNENLYEAHIPEAMLSFDPSTGKFLRKTLLESTSMVMSPVDITDPDLHRFPKFADARRIHCVLKPGDVLFMPAFWWHEVQSYPDVQEKRNLAVNFWYEPVLTKEFPCAECRLKFNKKKYRHFLYDPPL